MSNIEIYQIQNNVRSELDEKFNKEILELSPNLEKYLNIRSYDCPAEDVIRSLAGLSFRLINQMHTYDTVLTDDPSGRLVGIYLLEQIKNRKRNLDLSAETQLYGILGGRGLSVEQKVAVNDFIKSRKNTFGKTLLVTEIICVGDGIIDLARYLKNNGIDFDIASLSVLPDFLESNVGNYSNDEWRWLKNKVVYGDTNDIGGMYFYNKSESGIEKHFFSENGFLAHSQKRKDSKQFAVNRARRDIKHIAQTILETVEMTLKI